MNWNQIVLMPDFDKSYMFKLDVSVQGAWLATLGCDGTAKRLHH